MTDEIPVWERVADALYFIDNPEMIAQIASRFENEYMPALIRAQTPSEHNRAFDALVRYLNSGATVRKRWTMNLTDAERVANSLKNLL